MYHTNVKVNLMAENVTQIKTGITIILGVNVKIWQNIMRAKKIWNPFTCICENGRFFVIKL